MEAKERLIVALDVSSLEQARDLVMSLRGLVSTFKVGLELFCSYGPGVVEAIRELSGGVFLDLKFHDIPNTVAQAARAAVRMEVAMFNVHVAGGAEMLKAATAAVREESGTEKAPKVLGVTVLTSLNAEQLRDEVGNIRTPGEQVVFWAGLARDCGLSGVVASPQEIASIRQCCGSDFLIVTPGIRPAGKDLDDQKRVSTPGEALRSGADYLVVGRPIVKAPDPRQAAIDIIREMEEADRCPTNKS